MNHTLLRCCAALLLLLGVGVFEIRPAQAAIECTASISNVTFGNVDPQSSQVDTTGTLNYTCTNVGLLVPPRRSATLCFSIGEPAGGPTNPRQMEDGSYNTLDFQLYQNSGRSIIWGSQFLGSEAPLQVNITLRGALLGSGESKSGSAMVHGRVMAGQSTAVPGSYTNNYGPSDTALTINQRTGSTAPGSCSGTKDGDFGSFIVSASVVEKCNITASPLDFGTNPGLLNTAVEAKTTLGVQCSVGTAYNVGLNAGQNGGGDINARKMELGGNSVDYQLYQDATRVKVWGNTVGTNTVTGTGNGNTRNLTVHGRVPPQVTPPAGTYHDTVVVTVTY